MTHLAIMALLGIFAAAQQPQIQEQELPKPGQAQAAKPAVFAVQDGQRLVECEVWIENSRGEKTSSGRAVVSLPSRDDP